MSDTPKKEPFGISDEIKKKLIENLEANNKSYMEKYYKAEPEIKEPLTEEEEAEEIIRRLKTPPAKKLDENFRNIILPMIRRIIPGTIANEITSVQPMTGPTGTIHTLNYKLTQEKDEE